jgi:hypothetical protein
MAIKHTPLLLELVAGAGRPPAGWSGVFLTRTIASGLIGTSTPQGLAEFPGL